MDDTGFTLQDDIHIGCTYKPVLRGWRFWNRSILNDYILLNLANIYVDCKAYGSGNVKKV